MSDYLLSRFEIVLGDRLLEIASRPGELPGVHVDDRHRLGSVDHQRSTRREPDLAIQGLHQLLVDPVVGEDVFGFNPVVHAVQQIRCDGRDVRVDGPPRAITGDDQLRDILVEHVADNLDRQVGFAVEEFGWRRRRGCVRDVRPQRLQAFDVGFQRILRRAFGGRTDDHAGVLGHHPLENGLQPTALVVRQLATDARHRPAGDIHQESTRQGNLARQPSSLLSDRILGDLHQNWVAGLQGELDALGLTLQADGIPVHFARIQNRVSASPDVYKCRFHTRQNVLHPPEIHVANHGGGRTFGDVVLDKDTVLKNGYLDPVFGLADDHDALDRFASSEELRLVQNRCSSAPGFPAFASALLLGF